MLKKIRDNFSKYISQYKTLSRSMRHVIIFIGQNATYISVYKNNAQIDSITIQGKDYNIRDYRNFLDKFKKYHISILIDTASVSMQSADIPTTQGIINDNPVHQFITQHFSKGDIVAYNVHDVSVETTETWHTIFASLTTTPWYDDIVEYVTSRFNRFSGIYFFNLNIPKLCSNLLRKAKVQEMNEFKIFATITISSGIRVVATYNNNVLHSRILEYSSDKSESYIQGMVEQEITDCLISARRAIQNSKAKPTLILLLPQSVQTLIASSKFPEADEVVIIQLSKEEVKSDADLMDNAILSSLSNCLSMVASHDDLGSFMKLKKYDIFGLRSMFVILSVFLIILAVNLLEIQKLTWNTEHIDELTFQASDEYRGLKSGYANIQNLDTILDFHVATMQINKKQYLPFAAIDSIIEYMQQRHFEITQIFWSLSPAYNAEYTNSKNADNTDALSSDLTANNKSIVEMEEGEPEISITARYVVDAASVEIATTKLESDISNLGKKNTSYDITYRVKDIDIVHHGASVIIPVTIKVTGPKRVSEGK